MLYFETGSPNTVLSPDEIKQGLVTALDKIGHKHKVLVVPPDHTRLHSMAGKITSLLYKYYGNCLKDILPALGTHVPMTSDELKLMFGDIPSNLFRIHDWKKEVVTVGTVPGEFVSKITNGAFDYFWPAQLNRLVFEGGHDLILSVGQVVPHEVIGMANYNKNLFVGTGGFEAINKSHFLGAVYGMENLMGKADNPVRSMLNYASDHFIKHLPVVYIHTVIGRDDSGDLVMRGLFIGDDYSVFTKAADLSLKINFSVMDKPFRKVVVYLDPAEFKSTWLGNKSIYRTRMAMADNGEIIVIAPGIKEFGEDKVIDGLVRKYGYKGTPYTLDQLKRNEDLKANLSAAAHLIHGSSEGRFSITYCPGFLSKQEIEKVGFRYADINEITKRFDPGKLKDGYNLLPDGEEIYYISNPAIGLWSSKEKLNH